MEGGTKSNKVYGLGIASFVLSILSIVTMCYVVFSVVFGVLAVVLGVASLMIERKNALAIAGLVISGVSLFITLILFLVLGLMDVNLLYIPEYYQNIL